MSMSGPPLEAHPLEFPHRVPIKIIGIESALDPFAIQSIIATHLGEQEETEWSANKKGHYVSYTFWASLPDRDSEERLRKAIHALPGVVMQL
jgi:putative lipoic acid-binding regulatory protein